MCSKFKLFLSYVCFLNYPDNLGLILSLFYFCFCHCCSYRMITTFQMRSLDANLLSLVHIRLILLSHILFTRAYIHARMRIITKAHIRTYNTWHSSRS